MEKCNWKKLAMTAEGFNEGEKKRLNKIFLEYKEWTRINTVAYFYAYVSEVRRHSKMLEWYKIVKVKTDYISPLITVIKKYKLVWIFIDASFLNKRKHYATKIEVEKIQLCKMLSAECSKCNA